MDSNRLFIPNVEKDISSYCIKNKCKNNQFQILNLYSPRTDI